MIKYDAIVVASGKGTRLNLGYNKVFYKLDEDTTILDMASRCFIEDEDCQNVIVVTNEEEFDLVKNNPKLVLVQGGKLRMDSVLNGLAKVKSDYVLIHDGARPYLDKHDLDNLKKVLEDEEASILAVKVKETVKVVDDGYINKTLNRNQIYLAQTPQGFKTSAIINAFQKAKGVNIEFTDDASIAEYSGIKVKIVEGSYRNNKITYLDDLR